MPKASPIQLNLNAGEWSPLLAARVDQQKYNNSLTLCRNFLPLVQGGVTRRPGTEFVQQARDPVALGRFWLEEGFILFGRTTLDIAVNPFTRTIIAAAGLEGGARGLFRSVDEGLTWVKVLEVAANDLPPPHLASNRAEDSVFVLAVGKANGAADVAALFVSYDDGLTFQEETVPFTGEALTPNGFSIANGQYGVTGAGFVVVWFAQNSALGGLYRIAPDVGTTSITVDQLDPPRSTDAVPPLTLIGDGGEGFLLFGADIAHSPSLDFGQDVWTTIDLTTQSAAISAGALNDFDGSGEGNLMITSDNATGVIRLAGVDGLTPQVRQLPQILGGLDVSIKSVVHYGGDVFGVRFTEAFFDTTGEAQGHTENYGDDWQIIPDPEVTSDFALRAKAVIRGDFAAIADLGVVHRSEAVTDNASTRLIPFQFSVEENYILEAGVGYCRFYTLDGALLDGSGNPFEISAPWGTDALAELSWAQTADIMYFAGPGMLPHKLERLTPTTFRIVEVDFLDGPYERINQDPAVTADFDSVDSELSFSPETFVENISDFIGRTVRIFDTSAGQWFWFEILEFADTVAAGDITFKVTNPQSAATIAATDEFRLGAWTRTSPPTTVIFFEGRLWFGYGQSLAGSVVDDFENFKPTEPNGDVIATNAITLTLNANQVNVIRWLSVDDKGLIAGTTGSEWIIRRLTGAEALAPGNVQATLSTAHGSAAVRPLRIGGATLFVQRDTRTLRELSFIFDNDGFQAIDLTVAAEHLTRPGIREMAYQQSPQRTVWLVLDDGDILSLAYEREQDVLGWSRHPTSGLGQSVAVIPSTDTRNDTLWTIIRRTVEGEDRAYVERLTKVREGGEAADAARFVDSSLEYQGVATDTLTGLDHLEGRTVAILGDGATHPDRVVSGGSITLDRDVTQAFVGLSYLSQLQTQRIEAGAADGTAQGKVKRIHRVIFRFFETLNARMGQPGKELDRLTFRDAGDDLGSEVPLFTGDKFVNWPSGYETQGWVYLEQDQPLPLTLLAIMPQLLTQDTR